MLKIMFLRLRSKKWMTASLMIGIVLLIATVISFPMYKNAAMNRMLADDFRDYLKETGKWPLKIGYNIKGNKDTGLDKVFESEKFIKELYDNMQVTEKETIMFYSISQTVAHSELGRTNTLGISVKPAYISNFEKHAFAKAGNMFSETGYTEDGYIEVMISEETMISEDILIGESYELSNIRDENKNPLHVKVVGVFGVTDETDFYWQVAPKKATSLFIMNENVFRNLFMNPEKTIYVYSCIYNAMFEYKDFEVDNIEKVMTYTERLTDFISEKIDTPDYVAIMKKFSANRVRTEVTLFMLTVPILFLLCAFIFMVCGQIYESDANEISVIKSRGASTGQLFRMYLGQNVFLTLISTVVAVPLGYLFATVLGSTRSFMDFSGARVISPKLSFEVVAYGVCGIVATILVMTVPSIKYSKVSIVNLKQRKAGKKRSWWKKIYLDVICLGIAIYGYFSSEKSISFLSEKVSDKTAMDPLIYVSSSLMLVGLGLLFIRLQPYIIELIYLIGKKFWKPASYLSFKENRKNGNKEEFIILFLILSISLGMFNATIAQTLLRNAIDDAEYTSGPDIILKEQWKDNAYLAEEGEEEFKYFEPDYGKYDEIPNVEKYTKVFRDDNVYTGNGKRMVRFSLLGINTKEYGEITSLSAGINDTPYRKMLNTLALSEKGGLVSANFKEAMGVDIGDKITFRDTNGNTLYVEIVGFFDYWPGYVRHTSSVNKEGLTVVDENYLIVTHFSLVHDKWKDIQYEIWMKFKPGSDTLGFYSWINDNNIVVSRYSDKKDNIERVIREPLLQGTNGILTMGFLVTMLLCGAGYLIYWIMAIKSKELIFGILRASGMHKGEILHLLINEQLFTGGFAIAVGIFAGNLTSKMFVPALQKAYSASGQVLPMKIIMGGEQIMRLYAVIILMVVVCIAVLARIVRRMNITKALKLGED